MVNDTALGEVKENEMFEVAVPFHFRQISDMKSTDLSKIVQVSLSLFDSQAQAFGAPITIPAEFVRRQPA